ncbi:helix-turn-helix domain-containing protein [Paraburkholderia sp. C35]|uniref:helix-turn-helix domain-containing protein n=1 Tax=Paraburkholderia sp. C35 TaxID=2126993 RepID=UPI0013A583A8|nr:helix-turn-helix domain-containing protein [Paraburkholderia sp. C35]
MNVTCTTAELPSLLPMLAGLKSAFHLTVSDAPVETESVAPSKTPEPTVTMAAPVPVVKQDVVGEPTAVQQPAPKVKGEPRWYSTDEVSALFGHTYTSRTIDLMKRAGIDALLANRYGKWGDTRNYYDADKVDALKKLFNDTLNAKDAASLMGDKSQKPIYYHTKHRHITPTKVAGKMRYRLDDLQQLMRLRKIA